MRDRNGIELRKGDRVMFVQVFETGRRSMHYGKIGKVVRESDSREWAIVEMPEFGVVAAPTDIELPVAAAVARSNEHDRQIRKRRVHR